MIIQQQSIWNIDTGILDIEGNVEELSASEIPGIKAIWTSKKDELKDTSLLSNFIEKLSREWAIETGVIENLYDIERGVTQTLIERGFHSDILTQGSTNKPRDFVIRLLQDQKDALDGVFAFIKDVRPISTSYIKELHSVLTRSQSTTDAVDTNGNSIQVSLIKGEWKKAPNHPVRDGVTYTYCPPEHVSSEMDRLISMHLDHVKNGVPSEVQAAWLHHRFTQIHPFQDGNGRVARTIASLVLMKDDLFPMVVTRDSKQKYIETLEHADGGNLKPLIDFIVDMQNTQFKKVSAISEEFIPNVKGVLDDLLKVANKRAKDKHTELRRVHALADKVLKNVDLRFNEILPQVKTALKKVNSAGNAFIVHSEKDTNHYFRAQIIENAKQYLEYYADTSEYREWISLNMHWSRQAKLVFAIHGIGRPFNGSLICAPFLEFKDMDEKEDSSRTSVVPVTKEGFIFFYNEDENRLLSRFVNWREDVLAVALKELIRNL